MSFISFLIKTGKRENLCLSLIVSKTMSIPISLLDQEDEFIWGPTTNRKNQILGFNIMISLPNLKQSC